MKKNTRKKQSKTIVKKCTLTFQGFMYIPRNKKDVIMSFDMSDAELVFPEQKGPIKVKGEI